MHKCVSCKETDPTKFYGKKKKSCKTCHNDYVVRRARENKEYAVETLGGQCAACGYSRCIESLDFHHTDPNTKDLNWNNMRYWSKDRIDRELQSCVLLCANCHREVHAVQ